MLLRKSVSLLEKTKNVYTKLVSPVRNYFADIRERKYINMCMELEYLRGSENTLLKNKASLEKRIGYIGDEDLRAELKEIDRALADMPRRRTEIFNS